MGEESVERVETVPEVPKSSADGTGRFSQAQRGEAGQRGEFEV
ncbi:hypothetical protein [Thermobifida halotolerans]|nr:hypothetical protein [Thermobifida halotolerans]